jgi:hypothetical protein
LKGRRCKSNKIDKEKKNMNKKISLGLLLLTVVALMIVPGASAHYNQENACEGCHTGPPNSMSITTDISSANVNPGQSFNVAVTWSRGDPTSETAVKWPNNVLNNALFNATPHLIYPAATGGTQSFTLTVPSTATPGTYTVRVYVSTGGIFETAYKDITVNVLAPEPAPVLTTVTISPLNPSVVEGTTKQFTATTLDQNNAPIGATLSWSSSNTSVGTINSAGLFTAVAAGTTTITVTATNGTVTKTASTTATVTALTQPPAEKATVSFLITANGTGNPVYNAKVSMGGITIKTNHSGVAVFSNVTNGTYSYTVSKNGYIGITGSISVAGNTEVSVKLVEKRSRRTR